MKRPEFIYKYQSINVNSLSALNNAQLWFSDLYSLNDPFEAVYEFTPELIFGRKVNITSVGDTVTQIIKNSAICSFTKVHPTDMRNFKTNTLMWAHYGANFSGMCIEFRTDSLLESLGKDKRFSIQSNDVQYSNEIHAYNDPNDAFMPDVMFRKHFAWDYEEEFRVLCQRNPVNSEDEYPVNGLHKYDRRSITSIYIGGRLSLDHQNLLRVIVNKLNPNINIVPVFTSPQYAYGSHYYLNDEDQ